MSINKRVLVTGLTGFTGLHLKETLTRRDFRVIGIDQSDVTDNPDIYSCDLLDKTALTSLVHRLKPSRVIHLAGIASVDHSDKSMIYQVNIMGTRNLLEALVEMPEKPCSVILASTANIYGNTGGYALDEDTPPDPLNDYAVSKLAMEYMAGMFKQSLPITIVRPFNYTGLGQTAHFVVPKIVNHFKQRLPVLELGNLEVTREFNDVRRVAEAYVRLLEKPQPGQVFNLSSGIGATLTEIITHCRRITGHNLQIEVNPDYVRENEVKILVGSPARLDAAIGELPRFPLEETLRWMLEGGNK